ncbi:hypothetical protein, variant [Verruconis gallopava]|nr:hypothetical protein, variant [Verruconis gallopava]KIW05240.1 hypothetical protein, variant [Verruconis gallopava]
MNLKERVAAVEACRWVTQAIPYAPYVTSIPWIDHYGCKYVGHGDDITSDSSGEDCYRFVKQAGRFKVFKRTPGISTTDLVGRMLLCTRSHFIKSLTAVLAGEEGSGDDQEKKARAEEMLQRIKDYATDETGSKPYCEVWSWTPSKELRLRRSISHASGRHTDRDDAGTFSKMVAGLGPREGQRVVYVDGGFDLFSSGHIEFLRRVVLREREEGEKRGWFTEEAKSKRMKDAGEDYGPAFVLAGIHDDEVINHYKGINYPVMNIFERGLCVLQCKYINAVIFGAPFSATPAYLKSLPYGLPAAVYHGPTAFMPLNYDPYTYAKDLGIFREIPSHEFQHVNAGEIVDRILRSRAMYEERQRVKGVKGLGEEAEKRRQKLEEEAKLKAFERRWSEVERSYGA